MTVAIFAVICDILLSKYTPNKGGKVLKKFLRVITMCFLISFIFLMSDYKEVSAYSDKSSIRVNLDYRTDHIANSFDMPKDGKIKLNITVKDRDTAPGILRFAIQTGYSKDSEIIKEITGITSTNGVKDLEIDLTKGKYYFHYELSNTTGDLYDTVLGLFGETEILPIIPDNLSALSVHSINSFNDITNKDYEEINFGDEDERKDLVLPFTVDKAGGILISLKQSGSYDDYLKARIYQDKECTKPVGKDFLLNAIDDSVNIERAISKKGTYYIKFTCDQGAPFGVTTFKVKIYSISGGERTLSAGKATVAYQASAKGKVIYKINVKDTKSLAFSITPYDNSNGGGAYFRLLDKNKKQLTNKSYVVSKRNDEKKFGPINKYYTVNKGTYYLEVSANCSIYQLDSATVNIKNQAGSSKSKAKLLKGSALEGYFTISDKTSKADWYKFSVPTSGQYINFVIAYVLDGDIIFQILDSNGKILFDSSEEGGYLEGSYRNWVGNTYPKGTYYVKVSKGSKNSSLNYGVMVRKSN